MVLILNCICLFLSLNLVHRSSIVYRFAIISITCIITFIICYVGVEDTGEEQPIGVCLDKNQGRATLVSAQCACK